jgi:hypothetical protein
MGKYKKPANYKLQAFKFNGIIGSLSAKIVPKISRQANCSLLVMENLWYFAIKFI